jgi:hypothetical protein
VKALLLILVWFGVFGTLAVGCSGGDGDDGPVADTCEDVNQRICDLACACTDGDECKILSGAVTITHDDPADCSGFWVTFGCMQDEADAVDYAACNAALDGAQCADADDGMALQFPADCGDA